MQDEELVQLIWEREESGLQELMAQYGSRFQRLAERFLPEEDARECVNDTYLAVWNSIPPARPEYLYAYGAKICRNMALNRVKSSQTQKRKGIVVELTKELEECIPGRAVEDHAEIGQAIKAFVSHLPKDKQYIFVARYWQGASIGELSAQTGYGEEKIKSMLFRLRRKLKKELEKEGIYV
ncbi:MAG: sigma-70 family RNA polymerase sigma factor [Lachnospiraceae bacterium]|nr:sigma-70 family RNA polymerase sigma factor [Lachnospiraceae bacterium]